jgi:outer membrane protein OmpA-like peptidoglycan-associated protein
MRQLLLSIIFLSGICCVLPTYAQEAAQPKPLRDSLYLRKKDYPREADYEQFKYAFPPKKKNMWSLGINGGYSTLIADVNTKYGWGAGLTLQKAIGHVVAIRLQGLFSQVTGQDWQAAGLSKDFRNYKMNLADLQVQGLFYLNNVNFYKRQPKCLVYALVGAGVSAFKTKQDLLDANGNPYNYSGIVEADKAWDQFRVYKDLKALQDGKYETTVDPGKYETSFKGWRISPSIAFGAGLAFKLSRRVDLNFEERISWHNSDYMDGTNLNRNNTASSMQDFLTYSSVAVNIKLGKREEPLYWVNPLVKPYDDIMALKSNLYSGDFIKDEDEDGVADVFDKDNNTPKGALVNTHGVALDIDADGIADNKDAEPFTPKGAKIDKAGKAVDADDDGVADIFDRQSNSPAGALVDAKGIDISSQAKEPVLSTPATFNPVFFDLNKTNVKQEFYPSIYKVAMFMQENPNAKMVVIGHTDNRANDAYNLKLAKERAQAVVDILHNSFNISKDRFEIESKGKADPIVPNLSPKDHKADGGHYLNRRVTFQAK